MIDTDLKNFVREYWTAISGKAKDTSLLKNYIDDPELIGHILAYEKPFPRYELVADDLICEDDKVVVRARFKGSHEGDLMGFQPTGKKIEISFCVIYQIAGNKITKSWLFIDKMELMNKLGLLGKN